MAPVKITESDDKDATICCVLFVLQVNTGRMKTKYFHKMRTFHAHFHIDPCTKVATFFDSERMSG